MWEKRYRLIKPLRTATNRRYYTGEQLRKLMNVSALLSQGYKISLVASLTEMELNARIEQMQRSDTPDIVSAAFVHDLTLAMLAFDEQGFENVFSAACTRFGFYESMLTVFYPLLRRIGVLWSVDKAMPVQEHFASSIIRRKIIAATDGLLPPAKSARRFLLFLPQGEWHEVGLLFANYIIRSIGGNTVYLGQNVPVKDIHEVAERTLPDSMLTFFISPRPLSEITDMMNGIAVKYPGINVLVAGSTDVLSGAKFSESKIKILHDVGDLTAYV